MALELVALEDLGLDLKADLVWSLDPLSWGPESEATSPEAGCSAMGGS